MKPSTTTILLTALTYTFFSGPRSLAAGHDDLGVQISQQVQDSLKPLANLGVTISHQVHESLQPLNHLEETISHNVHESLKPVREMQTKLAMMRGVGGITVATFKGRTFVVEDGEVSVCEGTTSPVDGSCNGNLVAVGPNDNTKFCFASSRSFVNQWVCLGSNINVQAINGRVTCTSNDYSPFLLILATQYRELCGGTVTYRYYTMGPIGEHGPDVRCTNSKPTVCTFQLNNDQFSYSGSNIVIT